MPEVHFQVKWPDQTALYYSPSTAVHAHFKAGESYTIADFVERSRVALHRASERVRAKYGYTCSSAMDTLALIEETAAAYESNPSARVTIVSCG
jgi:uncharacterized repeat protein (TIGR04042 family)